MEKIYIKHRDGSWGYKYVGDSYEHLTFIVPRAVELCAAKFRCSKVFHNGTRTEPALGTPCGIYGGAPYSRKHFGVKRGTDDAAAAAAVALILGIALGALGK